MDIRVALGGADFRRPFPAYRELGRAGGGLFAAGFVWRERMHRWLGLGILACAVGRVFLSDVWKLETIYRILSFMALGIVLLALGFI